MAVLNRRCPVQMMLFGGATAGAGQAVVEPLDDLWQALYIADRSMIMACFSKQFYVCD